MATQVTDEQIRQFVEEQPQWKYDSGVLRASFTAATFPEAISWVDRIADAAEQMNHHPDIDIRWRTLHLSLSTHSDGAVTELDLELARLIEGIIREHN